MDNVEVNEYPKELVGGRWLVKCQKCGWIWTANTEHPKRCSFCKNPNPEQPRKYKKY